MSCCFFLDTLLGPLLLSWRVLCLCGTVLVGLLVGFPNWCLPAHCHVADLVTEEGEEVGIIRVDQGAPAGMLSFGGGDGGDWISGPGGGVKRVRLNRKTPAHLVRRGILGIQSRPRVWKRLRVQDHSGQFHADAKARRVHQGDEGYALVQDRTGVG